MCIRDSLRSGTHETARKLGQELWCYSCGHLNNPGLTLRESPVDIRTWFWLQEKWQIRRVMLWHSSVYGHTFLKPGADGRGDGQVFYFRRRADEPDEVIPSIRAEMLRDGVEDRQYFHLLKQAARRAGDRIPTSLRDRAAALSKVPDSIARTQYECSDFSPVAFRSPTPSRPSCPGPSRATDTSKRVTQFLPRDNFGCVTPITGDFTR